MAFAAENAHVKSAASPPSLPDGFLREMKRLERRGVGVMGHATDVPDVAVRFAPSDLVGRTHGVLLGATGCGKTALATILIRPMLHERATSPAAPVPCVVAYNGDLATKIRVIAEELGVDHVYFDPFDPQHLLPFQILRRDPAVEPEVQSYEVTTLFERATEAPLGTKQDEFTDLLFLLGIDRGLSVPALASLTYDMIRLTSEASKCSIETVRQYFAGKARIPEASLQGVRSRFHRLLRLPTTRKMLEGPGCVSIRHLLSSVPLIVDLSRAPLGAEDIGRFWAGMFTTKLTRAIFDRRIDEHPTIVTADEWQEGLLSAGVAEQFERLLSVSRSRRVVFLLISQSLAGAAKVSPALPKMVATNVEVQILGACSPEDARLLRGMLPLTGRRRREAPAPWEGASRSPFLTPSEELEQLVHETANMPKRTFWFFHRGVHPAVRFRTVAAQVP